LWFCLLPEAVPSLMQLRAPQAASTAALASHGFLFVTCWQPTLLCATVAALAEHRHAHGAGSTALLDPDFPYQSAALFDAVPDLPAAGDSGPTAGSPASTLFAAVGTGSFSALLLSPDPDDVTLAEAIQLAERTLCIIPLTRSAHTGGWPTWLRRRTAALAAPSASAWLVGIGAAFAGALRVCPLPYRDGGNEARVWDCLVPHMRVHKAIASGNFDELVALQSTPDLVSMGMQSLDDALFEMHESGEISYEDALRVADHVNALRLRIKLKSQVFQIGELLSDSLAIVSDGPTPAPQSSKPEPVQLRAFVPEAIAQSGSGIVDIWACLPGQEAEVRTLAACTRQSLQAGLRAGLPVARGVVVGITLHIDGLQVSEPTQVLPWTGEPANLSFIVHAPAGARIGEHVARAQLTVGGADLGYMHFMVAVAPEDRGRDLDIRPREAGGKTQRLHSAFASYATEDRAEMLARVQGMKSVVPDIDIFIDALSLRGGENWQDRIAEELSARDVLLLFWSAHAASSQWVRFEWQHILERRGLQAIRPVALADPRDAAPPTELASLHFGDSYLGCILAEQARRSVGPI
jgi:hypothetical protein